ncbi:hypothetical protein G7Y89_g5668 [Cudoniella acicularis]|uniref:Uncharacterized protein n=1 Tax=Cudoniella acicularis TaxID=354080 RepID=A0A8H4RP80_9HELO|nr:hypothetical protein G7Y89_g5668 [Cudoniella acicularis]
MIGLAPARKVDVHDDVDTVASTRLLGIECDGELWPRRACPTNRDALREALFIKRWLWLQLLSHAVKRCVDEELQGLRNQNEPSALCCEDATLGSAQNGIDIFHESATAIPRANATTSALNCRYRCLRCQDDAFSSLSSFQPPPARNLEGGIYWTSAAEILPLHLSVGFSGEVAAVSSSSGPIALQSRRARCQDVRAICARPEQELFSCFLWQAGHWQIRRAIFADEEALRCIQETDRSLGVIMDEISLADVLLPSQYGGGHLGGRKRLTILSWLGDWGRRGIGVRVGVQKESQVSSIQLRLELYYWSFTTSKSSGASPRPRTANCSAAEGMPAEYQIQGTLAADLPCLYWSRFTKESSRARRMLGGLISTKKTSLQACDWLLFSKIQDLWIIQVDCGRHAEGGKYAPKSDAMETHQGYQDQVPRAKTAVDV